MSLGSWMNEILIDWGIDPKLANMFDETIIAVVDDRCVNRAGLPVSG